MIRTGMLIVMLAVSSLATAALAQTAQERAACHDDAQKLCAGVMPGGGRILDCLAKQKDKASAACQKVLASHGK